jgi:hypothetical protein
MLAPKGPGGRLQRRALSPLRPGPSRHLSSPKRVPLPLREPLHFIVMTVTVVTLPTPMRFLRDSPLPGSLCTVTPIVTEKGPYLCGSLPGVTVVTLVTVIYGLILDEGMRRYFVCPYPFNLTRRTRRAEQGVPYLCDLRGHWRRRVCLTSLITRRCYPTTDHPCRRVGREHRRVSNLNPTNANPLLMPDTPAIVGFVGFCEKV